MFESISLSPDGRYVLTTAIERPFSFRTSYRGFPRRTSVTDRGGSVVAALHRRPLREGRSNAEDRDDGPRAFAWRPDAAAVVTPGSKPSEWKATSYLQLEGLSNRIANGLRDEGVKKGMRVCLFVKPGRDLIAITYALFKLGAVPVLAGAARRQRRAVCPGD